MKRAALKIAASVSVALFASVFGSGCEQRERRAVVVPNPGDGQRPGDVTISPSGQPPVAQPGGNPPGANPPGANPPGANPPGANPPGANPPGANPPGANPPGANPPGAQPSDTTDVTVTIDGGILNGNNGNNGNNNDATATIDIQGPGSNDATATIDVQGPNTQPQPQPQSQPNGGGAVVTPGSQPIRVGELSVAAPSGYTLSQNATAEGTTFVAYTSTSAHVALYHRSGAAPTTQTLFVNGAQVTSQETVKRFGNLDWKVISTSKTTTSGPHAGTYHVYGFVMDKGGSTYYGYGRAASAEAARAAAEALLNVLR